MNDKKILGMSLFGIIKSNEPWRKAHEVGMRELSERAEMPELLEKVDSEDYFDYVEEALGRIDEYKDLEKNERIAKRRGEYFERVLGLIRKGDYVDSDFVKMLNGMKDKFRLVLISTNTKGFIDEVLKLADAEGLFDEVIALDAEERDDKTAVFDKAGKVDVFVGSEKSRKVCEELEIKFVKYEGVDKLREVLG